jgi:RNA polymerase sigma factor (sigma-70 family)
MEAKKQKKSKCTVEADLVLLRRYRKNDQEALVVLFETHYGLIGFWVYRLSGKLTWVDQDDLMQLGRIGFWRAANTFEVARYRFFHPWARKLVWWNVYNSPEVRVVKETQYKNYEDVIKAQDDLMQRLGRKPTLEEVGNEAGLSKKQVDNALKSIAAFASSLETPERLIEVEDPRQIAELYKIEDELEEIYQLVRNAIRKLTPGQAEVIFRYYFSEPTTDRAIAEEQGKEVKAITMKRTRAEKKLEKIIAGDRRWNPRILNSF